MQERAGRRAVSALSIALGASMIGCIVPDYIEDETWIVGPQRVCNKEPPPALFALNLGGKGEEEVSAVAADPCAEKSPRGVVIGGGFQSETSFDGLTPVAPAGDSDAFVARYLADGTFGWLFHFGDASYQSVRLLAAGVDGRVAAAGTFLGSIDFTLAGGPLIQEVAQESVVITKLGFDGKLEWGSALTDTTGVSAVNVCGLAMDKDGNVTVAGTFAGEIKAGGLSVASQGARDIYVIRYDASGVPQWGKNFPSEDDRVFCSRIALDRDGSTVMTGTYWVALTVGGKKLEGIESEGRYFVAKLNGSGEPAWSFGNTSGSLQGGLGIAVDGDDNIVVVGSNSGTVDVGAGPVGTAGGADIFVQKLDPNGNSLWGVTYGGSGEDTPSAVAVDTAGDIIITGVTNAEIQFDKTVTSFGKLDQDVFLARLHGDNGTAAASRVFPGQMVQSVNALALDAWGNPVLGGTFENSIYFDPGQILSAGLHDGFAARIDPL